jgi:FeS assembly protein IscX
MHLALTWEGSYEIVLALREAHPDVDPETVGLEQLNAWIIALADFDDDPALVNESILTGILREWYEETVSQ